MPNLREVTASSTLNQDDYVNKLYDKRQQSQQGLIQESQRDSQNYLNGQSQSVRDQTNGYQTRTDVEAQASAARPSYPRQSLSYGASAQQGLSRGNQLQADKTALNARQAQAEAEIERQRQQLAQFYQKEIQRATSENDMQRAQQLYNAAKAEEQKLQSLRQSAATYAQGFGDNSILESIAAGDAVQRDTTTPTDPAVLKNEDSINRIYDANIQAQRLKLQQDRDASLSDMSAKQLSDQRQTDEALTSAYTSALQKARNAAETQTAYGMGTGTAAQAGLARDLALQKNLTDLRTLQLGKDAAYGQQGYNLLRSYQKALESANSENELKRAQSLYSAAEGEENNLISQQQWLGNLLAQQGDYSVLNKLYGLTPEQIARLFPASSGDGGGRELTGIPALDYGVSKEWADEQKKAAQEAQRNRDELAGARQLPELSAVDKMWIRNDTINQRDYRRK